MAVDSDESSSTPRNLSGPPWALVVRRSEVESTSSAATNASCPSSSPLPIAPEQTPFSDCSGQKLPPESSATETQPESSSDSSNGNAARSKKPAWNRPVNGVVEGSSVMGGSVSWPALSESTRSTIKSSLDSPKPLSDGSASSSQGPIISQTPQKQANTNANANSVANHGMTRQKSMKHRGGGSTQGGFRPPPPPPPSMPPPFPAVIEMPAYGNYGNFVPPVLDSSIRGTRPMSGVAPQSGNDHSPHSQRNSSRRNNFGGRPRGDGQYHHGGRRDHDRRDVHLPNQFAPPPGGYMPPPPPPPPPGSASFIAPPPMRPFVGPMGFDMAPPFMYVPALPPESFRGMPFIAQAPPAPMFFPVMDPPLPALIVKQIDYYFSDANLVKDDYLRSNMDDDGWVPIKLIASFPRVQHLTTDISLILDSLRASVVVEVKEQGDKIRRRNEWKKWTQSSSHVSLDSTSQTPGISSDDTVTTSIEKVSLNEVSSSKRGGSDLTGSETGMTPDASLPDESTGSLKMANGEVTAEELHSC
ncbi:la-related protein 1B-like isoform X1 [Coffea arabica]|uniref:La-related protein 1B-like isoform X1 n=1 Tax=Coffea arabica TaxID=13443 RepID=A0ABM4VV88_COFAR|nr:la-related protein 1B-like isoform X1 [Coffea arabica]XP_027091644.1 la-related protein 1B-like isoform X1 [Coffea arabica]